MNLRISKNQVRIRLSPQDLSELGAKGSLTESVRFNALETFVYELKTWNLSIIEATYTSEKLMVAIPEEKCKELQSPGLITIESQQENGSGEKLHVIVEKDMHAFRPDSTSAQ